MKVMHNVRAALISAHEKYGLGKQGIINNVVNGIVAGAVGLLVLAGVLVGVTAFGNTQTTGTSARNLTDNIGYMANSFGTQLPTVGTMFGVALILGAIGLIGVGIAVGARRLE